MKAERINFTKDECLAVFHKDGLTFLCKYVSKIKYYSCSKRAKMKRERVKMENEKRKERETKGWKKRTRSGKRRKRNETQRNKN